MPATRLTGPLSSMRITCRAFPEGPWKQCPEHGQGTDRGRFWWVLAGKTGAGEMVRFFVVDAVFDRLADGGFDSMADIDPVKASVQLGNSEIGAAAISASRTTPAIVWI